MVRKSHTVLALFFCFSLGVPMAKTQTKITTVVTPPPTYSPSSSLSLSPEPEDGRVLGDSYSNQYFRMALPLLAGWEEDLKGPVPSANGYYVLGGLKTRGQLKGMVLIDAQDMFFSPVPIHSLLEFAQRRQYQAEYNFQDTIDLPAMEVQLAGHKFVRLDYSGAGFRNALFSMIVRCHVVSVEITSRFPEVFKQLEESMNRISVLNSSAPESQGGEAPVCVKDYPSDATVIRKVMPAMAGPRFTRVPVRFVIDEDGRVKHIHVINALPDQARSVEDALAQWVFKPYLQNKKAIEIETGILFEFPPKDQTHSTTLSASQY